jgi:hypothetical protein
MRPDGAHPKRCPFVQNFQVLLQTAAEATRNEFVKKVLLVVFVFLLTAAE